MNSCNVSLRIQKVIKANCSNTPQKFFLLFYQKQRPLTPLNIFAKNNGNSRDKLAIQHIDNGETLNEWVSIPTNNKKLIEKVGKTFVKIFLSLKLPRIESSNLKSSNLLLVMQKYTPH